MKKTIAGAIAAATLLLPGSAIAQSNAAADATYAAPVEDDDDDFPWGLLGLLGLAGLIPRKRHDHVNIDNRTNH